MGSALKQAGSGAWREILYPSCAGDVPSHLYSSSFGLTTSGFPNFLMRVGPNSGLGHNLIIFMIEAQVNDALRTLRDLCSSRKKCLDVRRDVLREFNDLIQKSLTDALGGSGCRSWYRDHNSRNATIWPGYTWKFRQLMRRFNRADYEMESFRLSR